MEWYHNFRIVLSTIDKLPFLEQPVPVLPVPTEGQENPLDVVTTHQAWVKAQKEIAGLMLMTMKPHIKKNLEHPGAYHMLKELKTLYVQQADQELLQIVREFHTCKQQEGQSVGSYVLKIKRYIDNLECLGHAMTQNLSFRLFLVSLRKEYSGFVQNYNMHSMGKTVTELHDMLKLHEQTLPPKEVAPALHAIRAGRIQKNQKKKSHKAAKGNQGKGKEKMGYAPVQAPPFAPKPNNPPTPKNDNPEKDVICHQCGEVGHWRRNFPIYLLELMKKKKLSQGASTLGIFTIELYSFSITSWVYDTGCGTHICITTQGLRGSKKLKPGALSLYVGDGHRAAIEATGDYHLCFTSGAKINLGSALLWHCHLGHINKKLIEKFQHNGLLDSTDIKSFEKCVAFMSSKMARKHYSHQVERAKDLLGLIYTDVCGPFKIMSRQGAYYFVTFTDDFSRYDYVYLLKHKHEVFETFKVFQKEVENQLRKTIKSLRFDRGGDLGEPANYKAALLDPESDKRLNAINVEMQSMKDNEVWELVELPPDVKTIGHKWLFKKKTYLDGDVHTYKARLVAKGFTQTPRIDYEETLSPIADIRAIRILIAIAAFYDYEIWQEGYKKPEEKSHKAAKGNQGKGKAKMGYAPVQAPPFAPKPKNPPTPKNDNPTTDAICHQCGEVGQCRRNFPIYLLELMKKKNLSQGSSTLGIFTIDIYSFPITSWVYDTGCGTHICITTQGLRGSKKLKPRALSLSTRTRHALDQTCLYIDVEEHELRDLAKGFTQTPRIDYEETLSPVADIRAIRILIAIAAFYDYEIWQLDEQTMLSCMGKTLTELHAMFKTITCIACSSCYKSMKNPENQMKKSHKAAKGNQGKGKAKMGYAPVQAPPFAPKPKNPPTPKNDNLTTDAICHQCGEVGQWRRNFPIYLLELMKNKKLSQGASTLVIFTIELYSFPITSWVYDTGCGTHICITTQGLRGSKKLKPRALSLAKINLGSALLWHCHLGHINKKFIEKLQHNGLLDSTDIKSLEKCVACMSVKMARKHCSLQVERAKDLLGLIPTDVCGPFKIMSRQGAYYFITFINDFSRSDYIYLLKHKHEVFETFKVFQKELENQLRKTIKSLRSDRGGDLGEPANYKAALLDPESDKRLNAINVVMQSIKDNESYLDRAVHTYKARLVAKGFTQTPRIDYEETLSPVTDIRAIRILIAIAAFYDYEIWQHKAKYFATSSTDAEYITAFDASKEAVWIRKFISRLGVVPTIEEPINMYCYNTKAIAIVKDHEVTKGARHFRAKPRSENDPGRLVATPELLTAPTEGYEDAIVVLAITADNFDLKHGLLTLVQNKQFFGHDKEDPHAHVRYFNKMTSTLKFPNVPNTSIKLMLFPFSLEGVARIWLEKEPPRSIFTWDDLVSKFINHEAWDRFKDLLRACPHHGFSELHQLDTFYNALNSKDQDSLNFAAGGNFLDRMPRECLGIIESKSKVQYSRNKPVVAKVSITASTSGISPDVAELKDMVRALLLDKKGQSPAPVKAVEESCVTCGGAHSYRYCPATDGNNYRNNIQEFVSQASAVNFNQGNTGYRPPMIQYSQYRCN
nr:zinc finger, CCHC-type [Tanacetum cinerariifolium]